MAGTVATLGPRHSSVPGSLHHRQRARPARALAWFRAGPPRLPDGSRGAADYQRAARGARVENSPCGAL